MLSLDKDCTSRTTNFKFWVKTSQNESTVVGIRSVWWCLLTPSCYRHHTFSQPSLGTDRCGGAHSIYLSPQVIFIYKIDHSPSSTNQYQPSMKHTSTFISTFHLIHIKLRLPQASSIQMIWAHVTYLHDRVVSNVYG